LSYGLSGAAARETRTDSIKVCLGYSLAELWMSQPH
jgi:hypothetical protein